MITDFFIFIKPEAMKSTFCKTEPWIPDASHTAQAGEERRHLYDEHIYWKPASLVPMQGNFASGWSAH